MANITNALLAFCLNNPKLLAVALDFKNLAMLKAIAQELSTTHAELDSYTDQAGNTVVRIKLDTTQSAADLIWKLQMQYGHFLEKIKLQGVRILVETRTTQRLLESNVKSR